MPKCWVLYSCVYNLVQSPGISYWLLSGTRLATPIRPWYTFCAGSFAGQRFAQGPQGITLTESAADTAAISLLRQQHRRYSSNSNLLQRQHGSHSRFQAAARGINAHFFFLPINHLNQFPPVAAAARIFSAKWENQIVKRLPKACKSNWHNALIPRNMEHGREYRHSAGPWVLGTERLLSHAAYKS